MCFLKHHYIGNADLIFQIYSGNYVIILFCNIVTICTPDMETVYVERHQQSKHVERVMLMNNILGFIATSVSNHKGIYDIITIQNLVFQVWFHTQVDITGMTTCTAGISLNLVSHCCISDQIGQVLLFDVIRVRYIAEQGVLCQFQQLLN